MKINVINQRTAGFTLAELLVVVAIVLILAAIAIPIFSSATASAEEATCTANRRSIKAMVATNYLLDPSTKPDQAKLDEYVAALSGSSDGQGLCPQKGTYTLAGDITLGTIIIKCSKHGLTSEDELLSWIDNNSWASGDSTQREKYAKELGISEWSPVKGLDGKGKDTTYYLQFKTYGNNNKTVFLYAGPEKNISGGGQWDAKYFCDNTGLFGPPGQWYNFPRVINLGIGPDNTGTTLKNKLATEFGPDYATTLEKVELKDGMFKPTS